MHTGEECSHKKKDKSEPSSESDTPKKDKKQESEDPKPRIVLTFRSDKSGAKSSNMKIVSTEEKHEDVTPRRSNRARKSTWESDDDVAISPKKDKTEPQQVSENDEALDGIQTAKRSKRRCNKVGTEPITNAIARREQLCKETAAPAPRLFRRIKPTPKILENEELRIGLESQNNVRLGITPEKSIDGVRTRRSAHNKSVDNQSESISPESKTQDESKGGSSKNSMKKLKHLCELGLKSVAPEKSDEDYVNRDDQGNYEGKEEEDEEIDDDTEVISKLLQEDSSSEPESGGSEMEPIKKKSRRNTDYESEESDDEPKTPPRRSQRLNHHSTYAEKWTDYYSDASDIEYKPEPKSKKRRTLSDKTSNANSAIEEEPEEKNAPADADEGSAPASPAESNRIVGQCCCENTSNIFAAPTELPEPVFCQAIESVEDMRVGCSHPAARDERGDLLPMVRCGPRSPYLLACRLHAAQLAKHMCCPLCGLFCTQGEFYQCSEGHLFHLDCALPREMTDPRHRTGCPHCGVWSYCWVPANTACHRVRVTMRAAARPVYLPDQREQSTTAFLGFTKLDPTKLDQGPLIPEDLLPPLPVDIKKMCEQSAEGGEKSVQQLYDAIVAGETLEQIIPKIVGVRVNDVPGAGEACAHAAAAGGRADVLYALHCAGADLDVADRTARTPLMRAILALLENEPVEEPEEPSDEVPGEKVKEGEEKGKEDDKLKTEEAEDKVDAREHELTNVIKFLVAAGCDVDIAGPEGMSALHVAAAHGGAAACALLLGAGAAVDARDHGGWTPLVRAAENGHAACVKVLLDAGADAGVTDGEGHGALHWCALAGRASCLRLLLAAAPHLAAAPNAHADTPLHVAAREGHYACVIILLAHGARTDMENSAGELPVEVCAGRCQAAISLNMQVALAARGKLARNRMLSSDISNGREPWPVECANEVDDAPLPADFTYTSQLVTPAPLHVDCTLATMQGCACVDGACDGGACACAALGVRSWYVRGRLPANFPYHDPPMLFECNHTCACNMKRCGNRVVSRLAAAGSIGARVQVFRTARRGWGLRARAGIRRGAPVALYTGELLARRDADARANDQYMFALDLKQDLLQQGEGAAESGAEDEALCVDAARWGGAARFINHSCEPNVAPVRVYTHTRDLRLPTVALFALRDIPAMEELTFDYGDKFWSVKSKWMKCECESPDCRYPNKAKEDNA